MKKILNLVLVLALILSFVYSQTPDSILKEIENKWNSAKDITMKMTMTVYSYSSKGESLPTKMSMEIKAIKNPYILRIDFTEPALLAGQIFLIDAEKQVTRMYSPSTKQIIEAPYTVTQTSTISFSSIPMVGSNEDFSLKLEEVTEKNQKLYKITGIPQKPELKANYSYFEFFITKDYIPVRLMVYDIQNRLYIEILWSEVKINSNLSPNNLRTLPQGKIIKQKEPLNMTTPIPFMSPSK